MPGNPATPEPAGGIRLSADVHIFEDRFPDTDTARADVPEALLEWYRKVAESVPQIVLPPVNAEVPAGDMREVEIWLCSRETARDVFEIDDEVLGFHQITTPDSDPFNDESGSAKTYRVFVVCDAEERAHYHDEMRDYGPREAFHMAFDHAATVYHELAHVALFAANGNFNTPADIETLSDMGEINNDLFDMSSGYGICPLVVEHTQTWADDAEHARELMEAWCEEQGRHWLAIHSPGIEAYMAATGMEVEPEDDEEEPEDDLAVQP